MTAAAGPQPTADEAGPQVVEWQGAEVASVRWDGPDLVVRLATAELHASSAQGGTGFSQPVEVRLLGAQAVPAQHPALDSLVGRLARGSMQVGSSTTPVLTVPVQLTDTVRLDLAFANGEALSVQGRGLWARAAGPIRVHDDLRC